MIYDNILEAIGNTPLIKLNKLSEKTGCKILVKFEGMNVGGSIKTRTAYEMITKAEVSGKITPGKTTIVEPTSGNQGVGLALVAAVKGYKTIIIMPDSVSEERRKLVEYLGAKVKLIHDNGDIGECIGNCVKLANEIKENNSNVYIPQQFKNPANVKAHFNKTAREIIDQVKGKTIDGFCCGIGTGGTITGIGEALKNKYKNIKIWAVEPENAAILSNKKVKTHLQMGIGDGIIPDILNTDIYDKICLISDKEAIDTAKKLAKLEGLLCGITSGSNVAAAIKMAKELGENKTILTILPDTAERYYSTQLFN